MISLYDAGWRQGSIFDAPLQMMGVTLADDGSLDFNSHEHAKWIIVTQDCDLSAFDMNEREDLVELRPVFDHRPPSQRGIRSRQCLLVDRLYLEAQSRRTMISPAALTMLIETHAAKRDERVSADVDRKTTLKTWLGYRYDRPAVPEEHLALARSLVTEIERQGKVYTGKVRDVLVQIGSGTPPTFHLFAIIENEDDTEAVYNWLADAGLKISVSLGVGDAPQVGTADQTPLSLIENSFSLDLTKITFAGHPLDGIPGRLSRPIPMA